MKLLYAIDSKQFPGKIRLRFVEFTEELIDPKSLSTREFSLVDHEDPAIKEFIRTQTGKE